VPSPLREQRGLQSLLPGIIAALAAAAEIAVLLVRSYHGNPAGLALVGTDFSDRAALPSWIPQVRGPGYDGQFFLRLALDPFDLHKVAFGIHFDDPYRAQRLGFPFLAWLLALGHPRAVVWTMPLLEIVAAAGIAMGVTTLLSGHRFASLYGMSAALWQGYAFSYGRDLAEPVAASLVILGVLAIERWNQPLLGTVAFVAAVATLETELVIVGSYGIYWLWQSWQRRTFQPRLIVGIIPALAWLGIDRVATAASGGDAALSDLRANLGIPLVTQLDALRLHLALTPIDLTWLGQFLVVVIGATIGLIRLRSSQAPAPLRIALIAMIVLALMVAPIDWNPFNGFRQLDLLWLTSVLVVGSTENPPWWIPLLGIAAWLATASIVTHLL